MDFRLEPKYQELQKHVREVAKKVEPLAHHESDDVNWDLVRILVDTGVLPQLFPKEYGGTGDPGYQCMAFSITREELSRTNGDADLIVAMQGLGSYAIYLAGSEEQKQKYLPDIAQGKTLAAFALTEPDGGSDAAGLKTTAVRDGNEWVLNGRKAFISMAGCAGTYTMFARTADTGAKGISAFIVEADRPGFSVKPLQMTAPHPIGFVHLDDCRIPAENLLGEENQGFKIAMQTLDVFRASVGGHALGLAQGAYDLALRWAKKRELFGQPIAEFQGTQFKLAEMATEIKAARMLVYHAAWLKDRGERVTLDSAMAKMYATEMALRVVNHAVQIHGGYGVCKEWAIERFYRAVRAPIIYEGTSEIQRIVIARQLLRAAE